MDDSLHVPHTVLTERFPKRAFGKMPIFKLFADDTKRSGPSGSVSVYLALASSLFKQLIPSTILCSGELGLHGQIRPIGGELIKFREAYRAGVTKFLLHPKNCKMITDAVDPSLLAQVELIPVLHVRDAEKAVFGKELKDSEHIDGIETALKLADQVSQHPILLSLFGKNQIPGNTGSATAPSESLVAFRDSIEAMLTGQFSEDTTGSPM